MFIQEQVDQLIKLVQSSKSSSVPIAQSGIFSSSSGLSCTILSPLDHLSRDIRPYDQSLIIHLCLKHILLVMPMKELELQIVVSLLLQEKGIIIISASINLEFVLHVPKLTCNLLSVSKHCRDNNCKVIFLDSYCVFQDQISGKTIDSARMIDDLYYFNKGPSEIKWLGQKRVYLSIKGHTYQIC